MATTFPRVRFAPSPTGPLHIGGVRTALYNFLFARKLGGTLILRIEDTDQNRFVPGAEEYIVNSLAWCGIEFDESPQKGGPHLPYRQSERSEIYRKFASQLIESGHAYYAFDTEDSLNQLREKGKEPGAKPFQYDQFTRRQLRNSLALPEKEVKDLLQSGASYVVRVKIPENEQVIVNDLIRGEVVVKSSTLDDKVLFKSDGLPTYHLANVVDDYLMQITHVIRGEEWLPSAPLHVLLYRFLGLESIMPKFAHLPLILKPDGNGKLSKRDGDRLGFPVFPTQWTDLKTGEIYSGYRETGYLPEAVLNILAHLGWNPGTEQELFSIEDLIQQFSLERVGKHGSKFDPEKAKWFNHQYMQQKSDDELAQMLQEHLQKEGLIPALSYTIRVVQMIRERVVLVPDLWNSSWFFFKRPEQYDAQVTAKIWLPETAALVTSFAEEAELLEDYTHDGFHALVKDFTTRNGIKMAQLMNPLRLLMVGSNQGPGMMDLSVLLGKVEFLYRVRTGIKYLEEFPGNVSKQ